MPFLLVALLGCGGAAPEPGAEEGRAASTGPPVAGTNGGVAAPPAATDTPAAPGYERVPTPPVPRADPGDGWIAGTARGGAEPQRLATLVAVRTARHAGYDRTVFEFDGSLPQYHVEYVDRPVRQCGSGDPVPLPGDAWLLVRFEPSNAHTEEGRPTVADRDRALNYGLVKRLKLICDFEAQVEWVLAVASPNRFRVLELSDPARIVVDVQHYRW